MENNLSILEKLSTNELMFIGAFFIMATIFFIIFFILLILQKHICWICAFLGSLLYLVTSFKLRLQIESIETILSISISIYGYYKWKYFQNINASNYIKKDIKSLHITVSKPKDTILYVIFAILITILYVFANNKVFDINLLLDAVLSSSSVITFYLFAKKRLDSWLYTIFPILISGIVYFIINLYSEGFIDLFIVIIFSLGYYKWRKSISTHKQ